MKCEELSHANRTILRRYTCLAAACTHRVAHSPQQEPSPMIEPARDNRPFAGIKVLEMGALIAGPFCAKVLAEFGADVVKIEPPGLGDPLRKWRYLKDGNSVWWQVQS